VRTTLRNSGSAGNLGYVVLESVVNVQNGYCQRNSTGGGEINRIQQPTCAGYDVGG